MLKKLNIDVNRFRRIDSIYMQLYNVCTPVKLTILAVLVFTILIISPAMFSIIFGISILSLFLIVRFFILRWGAHVVNLSTNDCLPVFISETDIVKGIALMNEYRAYVMAINTVLKQNKIDSKYSEEEVGKILENREKFKQLYLKEYRLYVCWRLLGCILLSVCDSKESFSLFLEKFKSGEIR